MVLDIDFLKKILMAFQSSKNAFTRIPEVQEHGLDHNSDKFLFHMGLLGDMSLVENEAGRKAIAFYRQKEGSITWYGSLRLTAAGQDFATALTNDTVWMRVKNEFADQSITVLLEIAKSLVSERINKRLRGTVNSPPKSS